ncbi:methyl-accepting chemotaxis protein [Novispirillum sp. DQ9]|uniref:methyl-accepting chemotaxis protein n=1 Tax=Novispirillum sp. DQ9 TaxID=3398612 RepID=UPI003C7A84A4
MAAMRLNNLSLATKLVALVLTLSTVTGVVSVTGVTNINHMSLATDEIALAGSEALIGAQLRREAVAMNRGEFRIAVEPTEEQIRVVSGQIDESRVRLEDMLRKARATATDAQVGQLQAVDTAYAAYRASLEATLKVAREHGAAVTMSEAQRLIQAEARSSRAAAIALEEALTAYADYADRKAARLSQEASAAGSAASTLMIAVAALGVVGGLGIGWSLATFGVSRPIRAAVACLKRLASGDTAVDVYGVGRGDEIGQIAEAMETFKANLIHTREMEAEAERQKAKAAADQKAALNRMADSFEANVRGVVEAVSSASLQMKGSAQSMSAIAEEATRQATAVSAASEQASANVQTVASASEELAASVDEIGRQVTEAARIASQAVDEAEHNREIVQGLAGAADRIGEVIGLITDIASQTNLLALNATIEAARAGDAGKGFAVVANEVKALANQTARATDDIRQQITSVQGATQEAVRAIDMVTKTIARISEISQGIASAVEEQNAATREIARNVEEAAVGTQEVSSNIVGVTEAAGSAGSTAHEVEQAADSLSQQSGVLTREVDRFIATVRQAA